MPTITQGVTEALEALRDTRTGVLRPRVDLPLEARELRDILAGSAAKADRKELGRDAQPYYDAWETQGRAWQIVIDAGDGQTQRREQPVRTPPSVKVTDAFGNARGDIVVHFVVPPGSGTVAGATPRTDAGGIAAVGGWRLGRPGRQQLVATVLTPVGPRRVVFNARAV